MPGVVCTLRVRLVTGPDGIRNQIEGNVIQSISRTLHEEITFDRASPAATGRVIRSCASTRSPSSIEMVFVNDTAPISLEWRRRSFDLSHCGGHRQRGL